MKRREFLGTVGAALTARLQGPAVAKQRPSLPRYDAAKVEAWMAKVPRWGIVPMVKLPASEVEKMFALPAGSLMRKAKG